MFFIYNDTSTEPFTLETLTLLRRLDPNKQYAKHFGNSLLLKFFHTNPKSTPLERIQASKELKICERKMRYWSNFQGFNQTKAATECEQYRKMWATAPRPLYNPVAMCYLTHTLETEAHE